MDELFIIIFLSIGLFIAVALHLRENCDDTRHQEMEIQRDIEGNVINTSYNASVTSKTQDVGKRADVVFQTGYNGDPPRVNPALENYVTLFMERRQNIENPNKSRMKEICDRYKHLRETYAYGVISISEYEHNKEFIDREFPHAKYYIERLKISNNHIKNELDELKSYMKRHSNE